MTYVTDPIGDFINRLKNAQAAGHEHVTLPYSVLKHAVAEKLVARKFISAVEVKGKEAKEKKIIVTLARRADGAPAFTHVERVSKPGRRLYATTANMRPVQRGHGALIVSTSRGVLTDAEARAQKVGGEMLLRIW